MNITNYANSSRSVTGPHGTATLIITKKKTHIVHKTFARCFPIGLNQLKYVWPKWLKICWLQRKNTQFFKKKKRCLNYLRHSSNNTLIFFCSYVIWQEWLVKTNIFDGRRALLFTCTVWASCRKRLYVVNCTAIKNMQQSPHK